MRWDLFCRVIDNHGDLGVGWRLAADLAGRGEDVRLWVDDASALAWMAPNGAAGVSVAAFDAAGDAAPGDVAVELFGAEPPAAYLARIAAARTTWIDLEYLSAEPYTARSHALPSPQAAGPAAGCTRWFWFPGFAEGTGGLLREPRLDARRAAHDRSAWLAAHAVPPREGERVVVLFCYANPALRELLERLAERPTLLLAAAGTASDLVHAALGPALTRGALRAVLLPYLPQDEFDALLWSSDLNFVRGEDSLVRAIWADAPFVWQAYPQSGDAHAHKLDALLGAAGAPPGTRALHRWWNGLAAAPAGGLEALEGWPAALRAWRAQLRTRADLTSALLGFAAGKR